MNETFTEKFSFRCITIPLDAIHQIFSEFFDENGRRYLKKKLFC